MFKHKRFKYRSDRLLLLVLFAGLVVFMTTLSAADDSFLLHPTIDDLKDGDVLLAPIGQRGAGVRMLFESPAGIPAASYSVNNSNMRQVDAAAAAVHLSVVIPW